MAFVSNASKGGSAAASGLVLLFDSVLAAPAASIDSGANGIAGGHRDLLIEIRARSAKAAVASDVLGIAFNADAGLNQLISEFHTTGTTTASSKAGAAAIARDFVIPAATALPAAGLGFVSAQVMGYADAQFKCVTATYSWLPVADGTNIQSGVACLHWMNTAAITRIAISCAADNLVAGSRLTVYGTQ